MKALSLTQPWASLVASGAKRLETRSWYTGYRGDLVICASKGYPQWAKESAAHPSFREALRCEDVEKLPTGVALCVVRVVGCVRTTDPSPDPAELGFEPSDGEEPLFP